MKMININKTINIQLRCNNIYLKGTCGRIGRRFEAGARDSEGLPPLERVEIELRVLREPKSEETARAHVLEVP